MKNQTSFPLSSLGMHILIWIFLFFTLLNATENNQSETIHGHTLPPEPNKKLNDSTLLGIDSNNNGVRDDVERWIYHTYRDKHPIHVDILMQGARGAKFVLETPEKAKEIHQKVDAYVDCAGYYQFCIDDADINEKHLIKEDEDFIRTFDAIYFNTEERKSTYKQYNKLLSGGAYRMPWCSESKQYCDFNTSKYEEQKSEK